MEHEKNRCFSDGDELLELKYEYKLFGGSKKMGLFPRTSLVKVKKYLCGYILLKSFF